MAASSAVGSRPAPGAWLAAAALRPLQGLMIRPVWLYLLALTAMLFRPPDLSFYGLDRIALGILVAGVVLRVFLLRPELPIGGPVTWPMLGLLLISLVGLLSSPYQPEEWSTFAAKWAVPFVLFHIAQIVFEDKQSLHQLETYLLIILGYLSLMAIFFLIGAHDLIFPHFILDESIGIHFDRARGPFLQAVANGVAIVLLSLVALDSYRRSRLRGLPAFLFVLAIPFAVLATKTRSIWISFAGAVAVLCFSGSHRARRVCVLLAFLGTSLAATLVTVRSDPAVADRLQDRNPVEFRLLLYQTGWEMIHERPWWGWPTAEIQPELQKRMDGVHPQNLAFHNSFLEVAVNHGVIGLGLYLWVFVDLLRLGRKRKSTSTQPHFLDASFRELWPVLIAVYALNACFVVMNYQFVNALLFTLAGILAAQNRIASRCEA